MGPSLTGSDWRGVGRKASILLCIIVIIIFRPLPNPEAGALRDLFLLVQLGGSTNIQGGRGDIAGEVCEMVHARVTPTLRKKKGTQMLFDIFLVSQKPKLSQHNSNLG